MLIETKNAILTVVGISCLLIIFNIFACMTVMERYDIAYEMAVMIRGMFVIACTFEVLYTFKLFTTFKEMFTRNDR